MWSYGSALSKIAKNNKKNIIIKYKIFLCYKKIFYISADWDMKKGKFCQIIYKK